MLKRSIKKTLTIVISIALIVGIVAACFLIFKPKESKRIYPTYHIGSLNESGKHLDSDDSICSDLFECKGLRVEPDFSSKVKFSVYFYRFDETFVDCVTNQSDVYEAVDRDFVRYARIVITPDLNGESSEDHSISIFEIPGIRLGYAIFYSDMPLMLCRSV